MWGRLIHRTNLLLEANILSESGSGATAADLVLTGHPPWMSVWQKSGWG
jgi:hypothetical protein